MNALLIDPCCKNPSLRCGRQLLAHHGSAMNEIAG